MKSRMWEQREYSPGAQDWWVGVISTDYDLHDTRRALIDALRDFGFATVAFEQSDFPVQPHLHSHEACVRAVATMDIVVLILDRRYGGLYLGVGDTSVTEHEFWTAFNRRAVLVPCVSKKLYDDRHRCKEIVRELTGRQGLSEKEAKSKVRPVHAEGWALLDFLDRIQHSDRDQFMVFYEGTDQLVENVRGRLGAITPHFCRSLLSRQLQWVDSQRSTTGLFESLGHIGTSRLYISPPSRIISGGTRRRKPSSAIAEVALGAGSLLLTGDPGGGKTVELVRAFKRHAKKALREKDFRLPFYVPLKGRGLWYHFDFSQYLEEAFSEYLGRRPYPCFDSRHLEPVFYIDGLDEGPMTPRLSQLESAAESKMLRSSCVMTARSGFASHIIDRCTRFASRIATRVELLNWTRDHAGAFADRYLRAHGREEEIGTVSNYIRSLPEGHPVLKSPLILALFLWLVVAEGAGDVCNRDMGLGMLFEFFLQTWANRELSRLGHTPEKSLERESKNLISLWEVAAWLIFRARECGTTLTSLDLMKQVQMSAPYQRDATRLLASPAFSGMMRFTHGGKIVTGMMHDQFMEYLLARWFVVKCTDGGGSISEYLSTQTNVDVNRFVKAIWFAASEDDLKTTLRTLAMIARMSKGVGDQIAQMVIANCVYYISRVPLVESAKVTLRHLLNGERRLYCRNGILFALVRLGDMTAERQLYESLSSDAEAAKLNRGLHLEYFKDALRGELGSPPSDSGVLDWERCLVGLIDHLEDHTDRFVNSRRIDLFTIRSFLISRGELGPLTPGRFNRIRAALAADEAGAQRQDFRAGVELEFNALVAAARMM